MSCDIGTLYLGDRLPPPKQHHLAPLLDSEHWGELSRGGGQCDNGGGRQEVHHRGDHLAPPGLSQLQPPEDELRGQQQSGPRGVSSAHSPCCG